MVRKNWNQDYYKVDGSAAGDRDIARGSRAKVTRTKPGAPKVARSVPPVRPPKAGPPEPRRRPPRRPPAAARPKAKVHRIAPAERPTRPAKPPRPAAPPPLPPPPEAAPAAETAPELGEELPTARQLMAALGAAAFALPVTLVRVGLDRWADLRRRMDARRADVRDRLRSFWPGVTRGRG